MAKESRSANVWLKRVVIGLIAAIVALLVTRRTVLAPGSSEEHEYKLPPVPDASQAPLDDATPLTEAEQQLLAAHRFTAAGSGGDVPPPISYEAAKRNADEVAALRDQGTDEALAQAEAQEQRIYFTAPAAEHEAPVTGDTAPDATSESFDVSDGADHTGQAPVEVEDLTEVGLDIDVDLEDDEPVAPEITSEGFDTGEAGTLGLAASSGDTAANLGYIEVPDGQHDCPPEFPIKGNASSHIYHKPGESSYEATIPEICFASDEAAVAHGYRPRKR